MTDLRSPATRQADLDLICMILSDVDLTQPGDVVSTFVLPLGGSTEFVTPAGETIVVHRNRTTLGLALRQLAATVAGDPDRRYLERSCIVPSDDPDVLRVAVRLTPVGITLDGLQDGLFGIERMQDFASRYDGVDADTLPTELGEAVHLVRERLGIA